MGKLVGYARVSSTGQSLDVQLEALKAAGCTKIYSEKKSGVDDQRLELLSCFEYLREDDVLIITKLDRLARSANHLHKLIAELSTKRVGFRVLDQSGIDTTTATGKLVIGVLASVAEFEKELLKERQTAGIARAKAQGVYANRTKKCTDVVKAKIKQRNQEGAGVAVLTKEFELSRSHVYRILNEA